MEGARAGPELQEAKTRAQAAGRITLVRKPEYTLIYQFTSRSGTHSP
jgi:hypothetical protein